MAILPRSSLQTQDYGLLEKRVQEGHVQHHLNAPSAGCRHDVIVPWHGRQVQAYREYEVRCAGTPVDDALRDEPSLCPLTALAGRVEDASPTRAPSREVSWFHAARCRWRHKRPKRSPRLRSLGAWLQRFFAGRLGVSVQKVGVTRASSFPSPSGITVVESNRIGPMESPRALQIQASSTEETPTPSSVVQICQKWTPCNSAIAH